MTMSESAVQSIPSKHVPAWKRLGLKLKYAKDVPDEAPSAKLLTESVLNEPSTTLRDESALSLHKAKRRKTNTEVADERPRTHSKQTEFTPTNGYETVESGGFPEAAGRASTESRTDSEDTNNTARLKAVSQRKSVTFTSDTKEEDGFSAARLFQEWTAQDQAANAPEAASSQPPLADTTFAKKPNQKKPKKPKSGLANTDDPKASGGTDTGATLEYVQYLQHFYTDKTSWKFNKKKQKDLLKNIYNVYRVSPKYNDALIAYIAGLQGLAVQQRLIEGAEDVLESLLQRQDRAEEIEGLGSRSARKAAYKTALQREVEKLDGLKADSNRPSDDQVRQMQFDYERSKRAEAVLSELLKKDLDRPPQPPPAQVVPIPQSTATAKYTKFDDDDAMPAINPDVTPKSKPAKRKRKSRTEVSSSSESSSSSSESNSNDSDSDSDSD